MYDAQHRNALRAKIKLSIILYHLDPVQHQVGLVNVITGMVVVHTSVKVNNAAFLGENQMETFEKSWPGGFHDTITKTMMTMADNRKHVKEGGVKVFDTEAIYARAMGLQSGQRSLDADSVMAHELSLIQSPCLMQMVICVKQKPKPTSRMPSKWRYQADMLRMM